MSYERKSDECAYYYYDCGYCCEVKKEKEGSSSIDSDLVHKYCWGNKYEYCPRYKNRDKYYRSYDEIKDDDNGSTSSSSSSGPCFLTSACVEARGLADDCHELQTLRTFRDGYMRNLPEGAAEVQEYYRVAPPIVAKIKEQANSLAVFDTIYRELVEPCVRLIEAGENEQAHRIYRDYVARLQEQYA